MISKALRGKWQPSMLMYEVDNSLTEIPSGRGRMNPNAFTLEDAGTPSDVYNPYQPATMASPAAAPGEFRVIYTRNTIFNDFLFIIRNTFQT